MITNNFTALNIMSDIRYSEIKFKSLLFEISNS